MLTLTTPLNKKHRSLSVAYVNHFALDMNTSKNKQQISAKSKSDAKKNSQEESNWKRNLKRIEISKNRDQKLEKEYMYDQSSMFLFAIPK